ncbi:hypothetical protein GY50_0180 [Dehalococcoides mccartyi GY50]|nr:hypothetical protein GY50_0180 [Dehalococcoides mccartyi GY50]
MVLCVWARRYSFLVNPVVNVKGGFKAPLFIWINFRYSGSEELFNNIWANCL